MRWGVFLYNMFYTCPQPLANVGCLVMRPRLFSSVHFSHDRLTVAVAVGSDLLKKVCLHLTPFSSPLTVHTCTSIDFTCKMALMAPDSFSVCVPLNWGARSRFSYLTTNQWWDSLSSIQLMIGPTRFEKEYCTRNNPTPSFWLLPSFDPFGDWQQVGSFSFEYKLRMVFTEECQRDGSWYLSSIL